MRIRSAAVILLLAGGSVAGAAPARTERGTTPPACEAVEVRALPETAAAEWTVAGQAAIEVRFRVAFREKPNELAFRYLTPNGHLYQKLAVPVGRPGRELRERVMPGRRFGVTEAPVLEQREGRLLRRVVELPAFPVGGTPITQASLYGDWTLVVEPGQGHAGCSQTFTIQPWR